ncbi:MAG: nucleotide exchange factor GrpE [Aeromonadaceae bacterium]|nr:nucleotide exchange factor GrpE [Aeromonadaceae bacterium]MBP9568972.1 nucleotide exchange factor GrpE [Aeromonadaceae bacterium]
MSNQEQELEQSAELINEEQRTPDVAEPAVATDELSALQQQLATAVAAAQEEKDRALRIAAEMENLRRRSAQDVEKAHKFALEKFAGELLPVIDSLERALELADRDNETLKPMMEGVELTLRAMLTTVGKFGVEQVNPMGDAFDPNRHQAISMVENGNVAPNSVMAVMQKGYELNGRVIRPAMVMVARAPAASVDTQA